MQPRASQGVPPLTPLDTTDTIDDAADTLRFRPVFDADVPSDPDATSIYDISSRGPSRYARRRMIRETRQGIAGLRAAIAAGWDVGPELAHEQQRLAALEAREDLTCT